MWFQTGLLDGGDWNSIQLMLQVPQSTSTKRFWVGFSNSNFLSILQSSYDKARLGRNYRQRSLGVRSLIGADHAVTMLTPKSSEGCALLSLLTST
jgi:hypothetical protein